jgi:hypothetical protein
MSFQLFDRNFNQKEVGSGATYSAVGIFVCLKLITPYRKEILPFIESTY